MEATATATRTATRTTAARARRAARLAGETTTNDAAAVVVEFMTAIRAHVARTGLNRGIGDTEDAVNEIAAGLMARLQTNPIDPTYAPAQRATYVRRLIAGVYLDTRRAAAPLPRREWLVVERTAAAAAKAHAAGTDFTAEDRDGYVRDLCAKDFVLRHRTPRWVEAVAIPAAAEYVTLDGTIRPVGPRNVDLIAAAAVPAAGDTITADGITDQFDAMCDNLALNSRQRARAAARLADELARVRDH